MQQPSISFNDHTANFGWKSRLRAAGIHLALSAMVAASAALLVFVLWYPYPFREISGGRELFRLVVTVDVILGPLITFAIFNRAKPRAVLGRDLVVVAILQLAGLAYGLWTVYLARPVHLVFESDRVSVVHHADIPKDLAGPLPPGIQLSPLDGPTPLGLRPFRDEKEKLNLTLAALNGVPLAANPQLWQPYGASRADVLKAAHPVAQLKTRFPQHAATIDEALRKAGKDASGAAYLPMIARKAAWTVLLDARTADIIGYLPLDSF